MSTEDQNQDFEKLQRLLKLKRHEQPPPRYFNNFSSEVTARIRSGGVRKLESFEDVIAQSPWLQRLWLAVEGKPAVSGIFAAGVCGLLLAGIFLADKAPNTLPTFAENEKPSPAPNPESLFASPLAGMGTVTTSVSSTNPTAVIPGNSLFTVPGLQTMPVSGMPLQLAPR